MIALGLCSLAFDFLAALLDGAGLPAPLLCLVNIIYLLCVQLNGPVFLIYALVLTGIYPKFSKTKLMLLFAPFAIVAALLFMSPFCPWGIFYIDQGGVYYRGALHITLYSDYNVYTCGRGGGNIAAQACAAEKADDGLRLYKHIVCGYDCADAAA